MTIARGTQASAASGPGTLPSPGAIPVADALALAQQMHRDAQLEGAEQLYLRIIGQDPRNADAWHFLGLLRYQRRETANGIAAVRESLALAPDYGDAHANLANMLLGAGDARGCEQHLKHAVRLLPRALAPRLTLGVLLRVTGRADAAIRHLEQLLPEFPDNALVHNALGKALFAAGRVEEALPHFVRTYAIKQLSGNRAQASYALCMLERHDEARAILEEWLQEEPDNPTARHLLAACGATRAPERCNDGYVKELFDGFSESFDARLECLEYRAPDLIADACARLLGEPCQRLDVIDAGCGTGLLGVKIAPWCRRLVGVDLSPGMMAVARTRDVYDDLVEDELTAYLRKQPGASVDAVTSADTLCYFGAIDEVATAALAALKPGGWLVFTLEHDAAMEQDSRLQFSGRYCHRRGYVEQTLKRSGFEPPLLAECHLRMEGGKPVHGLVVAARKPQHVA